MKQIGRYHIIRKLGKGGMGSVFKGIVPVIDKVVAIKLLDPFETMLDILGAEKLKQIFLNFQLNGVQGLLTSTNYLCMMLRF